MRYICATGTCYIRHQPNVSKTERVSQHSVTILKLHVVTAGLEHGQIVPPPPKELGLGSPLAVCSVQGITQCNIMSRYLYISHVTFYQDR